MKSTGSMQTSLDNMVSDSTLQLLKAVLPYIGGNHCGTIAVFIKMIELMNTIKMINKINYIMMSKPKDSIMEELKCYMDSELIENFEMITSMMEMMQSADTDGDNDMSEYMELFKELI